MQVGALPPPVVWVLGLTLTLTLTLTLSLALILTLSLALTLALTLTVALALTLTPIPHTHAPCMKYCRTSAAPAATSGAAMDVPLFTSVVHCREWANPSEDADVMLSPGATSSGLMRPSAVGPTCVQHHIAPTPVKSLFSLARELWATRAETSGDAAEFGLGLG